MDPGKIAELVGNMADFILEYAIALAAVGALSMALIEAFKALFNTREFYHRRCLWRWLSTATTGAPATPEKIYQQLLMLTTGESADAVKTSAERWSTRRWYNRFRLSADNAVFTLELEKMMGQLQDAADLALHNPKLYPDLYTFVTLGAAATDVNEWREAAEQTVTSEKDPTSDERKSAKETADRYARLSKHVRRRLDSFQLLTGHRWTQANRGWSIAVGFALMVVALVYLEWLNPAPMQPVDWLRIAVAATLGGVIAPIAKDLVVALRKVRSG